MMETLPSTSKGYREGRENLFGSSSLGDRISFNGSNHSGDTDQNESQNLGVDSTIFDDAKLNSMLPWLKDYINICLANVGVPAFEKFEKLMQIFKGCATENVKMGLKKPFQLLKLRKFLTDFLNFFYNGFIKTLQPSDHNPYLILMSDLLSLYVDMEIKAAEVFSESQSMVASRIIMSLNVYLGGSLPHMIDVFLKATLVRKSSQKICGPVMSTLLDMEHLSSDQKHWLLYVRYILAFKIYKKLLNEAKDKIYVTQLVSQKLPAPADFEKSMAFSVIFPAVSPKGKKDITSFLLNTKFDVKESTQKFLTNYVGELSFPPNVMKKLPLVMAGKTSNEVGNKHTSNAHSLVSNSNSKKSVNKNKKRKAEKSKIKVNKKNNQKKKIVKENEGKKMQKDKKNENMKERVGDYSNMFEQQILVDDDVQIIEDPPDSEHNIPSDTTSLTSVQYFTPVTSTADSPFTSTPTPVVLATNSPVSSTNPTSSVDSIKLTSSSVYVPSVHSSDTSLSTVSETVSTTPTVMPSPIPVMSSTPFSSAVTPSSSTTVVASYLPPAVPSTEVIPDSGSSSLGTIVTTAAPLSQSIVDNLVCSSLDETSVTNPMDISELFTSGVENVPEAEIISPTSFTEVVTNASSSLPMDTCEGLNFQHEESSIKESIVCSNKQDVQVERGVPSPMKEAPKTHSELLLVTPEVSPTVEISMSQPQQAEPMEVDSGFVSADTSVINDTSVLQSNSSHKSNNFISELQPYSASKTVNNNEFDDVNAEMKVDLAHKEVANTTELEKDSENVIEKFSEQSSENMIEKFSEQSMPTQKQAAVDDVNISSDGSCLFTGNSAVVTNDKINTDDSADKIEITDANPIKLDVTHMESFSTLSKSSDEMISKSPAYELSETLIKDPSSNMEKNITDHEICCKTDKPIKDSTLPEKLSNFEDISSSCNNINKEDHSASNVSNAGQNDSLTNAAFIGNKVETYNVEKPNLNIKIDQDSTNFEKLDNENVISFYNTVSDRSQETTNTEIVKKCTGLSQVSDSIENLTHSAPEETRITDIKNLNNVDNNSSNTADSNLTKSDSVVICESEIKVSTDSVPDVEVTDGSVLTTVLNKTDNSFVTSDNDNVVLFNDESAVVESVIGLIHMNAADSCNSNFTSSGEVIHEDLLESSKNSSAKDAEHETSLIQSKLDIPETELSEEKVVIIEEEMSQFLLNASNYCVETIQGQFDEKHTPCDTTEHFTEIIEDNIVNNNIDNFDKMKKNTDIYAYLDNRTDTSEHNLNTEINHKDSHIYISGLPEENIQQEVIVQEMVEEIIEVGPVDQEIETVDLGSDGDDDEDNNSDKLLDEAVVLVDNKPKFNEIKEEFPYARIHKISPVIELHQTQTINSASSTNNILNLNKTSTSAQQVYNRNELEPPQSKNNYKNTKEQKRNKKDKVSSRRQVCLENVLESNLVENSESLERSDFGSSLANFHITSLQEQYANNRKFFYENTNSSQESNVSLLSFKSPIGTNVLYLPEEYDRDAQYGKGNCQNISNTSSSPKFKNFNILTENHYQEIFSHNRYRHNRNSEVRHANEIEVRRHSEDISNTSEEDNCEIIRRSSNSSEHDDYYPGPIGNRNKVHGYRPLSNRNRYQELDISSAHIVQHSHQIQSQAAERTGPDRRESSGSEQCNTIVEELLLRGSKSVGNYAAGSYAIPSDAYHQGTHPVPLGYEDIRSLSCTVCSDPTCSNPTNCSRSYFNRAQQIPINYHSPIFKSKQSADLSDMMQSQEDDLLRKIEKSLAQSSCKNSELSNKSPDSNDTTQNVEHSRNNDTSLPLKKRLKSLPCPDTTEKVETKPEEPNQKTSSGNIISYPSTPMLSIAAICGHPRQSSNAFMDSNSFAIEYKNLPDCYEYKVVDYKSNNREQYSPNSRESYSQHMHYTSAHPHYQYSNTNVDPMMYNPGGVFQYSSPDTLGVMYDRSEQIYYPNITDHVSNSSSSNVSDKEASERSHSSRRIKTPGERKELPTENSPCSSLSKQGLLGPQMSRTSTITSSKSLVSNNLQLPEPVISSNNSTLVSSSNGNISTVISRSNSSSTLPVSQSTSSYQLNTSIGHSQHSTITATKVSHHTPRETKGNAPVVSSCRGSVTVTPKSNVPAVTVPSRSTVASQSRPNITTSTVSLRSSSSTVPVSSKSSVSSSSSKHSSTKVCSSASSVPKRGIPIVSISKTNVPPYITSVLKDNPASSDRFLSGSGNVENSMLYENSNSKDSSEYSDVVESKEKKPKRRKSARTGYETRKRHSKRNKRKNDTSLEQINDVNDITPHRRRKK